MDANGVLLKNDEKYHYNTMEFERSVIPNGSAVDFLCVDSDHDLGKDRV